MRHLSDRIAAFIDGELDHAERDRVMVHLATCAACRAEVAAHRAVKARLAGLGAPAPSPQLLAEIRRLAEPGEPMPPPVSPARRGDRTTRPPTVGVGPRPASGQDRRALRARRRAHVLAATGLLAVTATLLTAFAVGGGANSQAPPVTPDIDSYMIEHAWTTRDVPFAELPAGAVGVSFRTGTDR